MDGKDQHSALLLEIATLKDQLLDANNIIEAIREGAVDALILNKDGQPHVYSIESADYTYRVLIEKFGEGALSISDEGLILYCNDYFSKLLGIPANQLVGTFFKSYFETPEAFEQMLTDLKTGPAKGEIILNGRNRQLHTYLSLTDLHPNVFAIGAVVTDLTQKRKHEEALIDYQRKLELKVNELNLTNTNLEQFIHVISHDLKEPLRKIVTYTSYLDENQAEIFSESTRKTLGVINSSALRLNSLVDDLVKYAFSSIATEIEKVDLNKVVAEVTDDLELIISEKKTVINCEELPVISGSKVQMRQLFSNLISNSVKYSRKNVTPQINITSEIQNEASANPMIKISLTDNGIGMNPKHISKIFTIFQRLHMRDEYSGNGIGLAICKKIMENHHGMIEVQSIQDKGSTFNLYFPLNND